MAGNKEKNNNPLPGFGFGFGFVGGERKGVMSWYNYTFQFTHQGVECGGEERGRDGEVGGGEEESCGGGREHSRALLRTCIAESRVAGSGGVRESSLRDGRRGRVGLGRTGL